MGKDKNHEVTGKYFRTGTKSGSEGKTQDRKILKS
jgi:hypothetical protein